MSKTKKITVHAPATSANLGPGFDVLGVALNLYNEVTFEAEMVTSQAFSKKPLIRMDIEGEGAVTLPHDATNLVVRAAYRVFDRVRRWPSKFHIRMVNRIPLSRGLGSSSATIVAGLAAANRLCGSPMPDQALLDLAVGLEGHPDNVVPSFVGGLCVCGMVDRRTRYLKFKVPADLRAVVCIPEKQIETTAARRVLPSRIPLSAAVFTSSHAVFLLGSILQKRYDWLGFAKDDVLHQPARASLIPGFSEVLAQAKKAGAYGAALSGSGSSVLAFSKSGATAKAVGEAMQKRFAAHGMPSRWLELKLEDKGIRYK